MVQSLTLYIYDRKWLEKKSWTLYTLEFSVMCRCHRWKALTLSDISLYMACAGADGNYTTTDVDLDHNSDPLDSNVVYNEENFIYVQLNHVLTMTPAWICRTCLWQCCWGYYNINYKICIITFGKMNQTILLEWPITHLSLHMKRWNRKKSYPINYYNWVEGLCFYSLKPYISLP